MDISITGPADTVNTHFQESARRQLIRAFGNYSGSIVCIEAKLSEEVSGQDGPTRQCRLFIQLLGFGFVTSEAWHENPLSAVIRAADRARQKMFFQMSHPRRQFV